MKDSLADFLRKLLYFSSKGTHRFEFLRDMAQLILASTPADAFALLSTDKDLCYYSEAALYPEEQFQIRTSSVQPDILTLTHDSIEILCSLCIQHKLASKEPGTSFDKAFQVGESTTIYTVNARGERKQLELSLPSRYKSIVFLPFSIDSFPSVLVLKAIKPSVFNRAFVNHLELLVLSIGLAAAEHRNKTRLRERVKELECFYSISKIAENRELTLEELLQKIVKILPEAMQFSASARAILTFDGDTYRSHAQLNDCPLISESIVVNGFERGVVSLSYSSEVVTHAEELFLPEELSLLRVVAITISRVIDKKLADTERQLLIEQLHHADRLLTIGHFASGVAHQLNEPLSSVLGFTQLAMKSDDLPDCAKDDLSKVVVAALSAREIVKKLLVFSRQTPTEMRAENINDIIQEALQLVEYRLNSHYIELDLLLAEDLPDILCNSLQIQQVLVNLIVNAQQAMPEGGKIIISSRTDGNGILVSVKDSGRGVDSKIRDKIFLPFFTTKEVGEGTGLGLSVVHGIVSMHKGTIALKDRQDKGACFEIWLPII